MNKDWSDRNKTMQKQLGNRKSFEAGRVALLELRQMLMKQMMAFRETLSDAQMCEMPYMNAKGYHSKTIAYSLYHIFRIEDIVAHTLIAKDEEVFFKGHYKERMHAPIVTTGNELVKQQIADFSKALKLEELFSYIEKVDRSTTALLLSFTYEDMKKKFSDEDKARLRDHKVVADCDEARWLIDYWCSKDIRGLIKMPFSRHWIMHLEACIRIRDKVV